MNIEEYSKINIERRDSTFRWYRCSGSNWVPSVTTILNVISKGKGFEKWLADQPSYKAACEERDQAAERGTIVHESIEKLIQGDKVECENSEIGKHLMCFEKFWADHEVDTIAQELFLIDSKYGFAGTPDLICNIDGKLWIIDFKTGGNYKTHNLQCRMYALLYEAIFDKKVDVIAGMYTKSTWIKEPNYILKKFPYNDKAKAIYDNCINGAIALWKYNNGTSRLAEPYPAVKPKIKSVFKLGGKSNGNFGI